MNKFKVLVVTLKYGIEKTEAKEIETTSSVHAIIEVLEQHQFSSVQSISIEPLNDAIN